MSITTSAAAEAARAAPPVAVAAVAVAEGITINHVVGVATLLYIALQALYLVWRWRREARNPASGRGGECRTGEGAQ